MKLKRKLDEAEMDYANLPKKMAQMHWSEGYCYENRNPYSLHTGEWNQYENAFFNLQLRRSYE